MAPRCPSKLAAWLLVLGFVHATTLRADEESETPGEVRYTRADLTEDRAALEVAMREMVPEDGEGPRVWLVGVIHIADASYYEALQSVLDLYPAVLYESVMPPGAGRLRDDTPEARVEDTEIRLALLAQWAKSLLARGAGAPDSFGGLVLALGEVAPRLGHFAGRSRLDAWGRSIRYERREEGFRFLSLGADGEPGGEGEAKDLEVGSVGVPKEQPGLRREPFDLQGRLAAALDLVHQGDGIDYGRDGWEPSDMAIDEIRRAVAARGGDFAQFEDMLAGRGLRGVLVRLFLGLLRAMDAFTGGEMKLAVKAALVESLGTGPTEPEPDGTFDEATIEVVIDDRNETVMQDLDLLRAVCPELPSIAIFYGAGHMPDFERRLASRGYRPGRMRWLRAIDVDLSKGGRLLESMQRRLERERKKR